MLFEPAIDVELRDRVRAAPKILDLVSFTTTPDFTRLWAPLAAPPSVPSAPLRSALTPRLACLLHHAALEVAQGLRLSADQGALAAPFPPPVVEFLDTGDPVAACEWVGSLATTAMSAAAAVASGTVPSSSCAAEKFVLRRCWSRVRELVAHAGEGLAVPGLPSLGEGEVDDVDALRSALLGAVDVPSPTGARPLSSFFPDDFVHPGRWFDDPVSGLRRPEGKVPRAGTVLSFPSEQDPVVMLSAWLADFVGPCASSGVVTHESFGDGVDQFFIDGLPLSVPFSVVVAPDGESGARDVFGAVIHPGHDGWCQVAFTERLEMFWINDVTRVECPIRW